MNFETSLLRSYFCFFYVDSKDHDLWGMVFQKFLVTVQQYRSKINTEQQHHGPISSNARSIFSQMQLVTKQTPLCYTSWATQAHVKGVRNSRKFWSFRGNLIIVAIDKSSRSFSPSRSRAQMNPPQFAFEFLELHFKWWHLSVWSLLFDCSVISSIQGVTGSMPYVHTYVSEHVFTH